MGTNYYMLRDACEKCGRSDDRLHIGKSSAGWCFALHVIPEDGINDWPDWLERLKQPGVVIQNEYGEVVTLDKLTATVMNREWTGAKQLYPQWYTENHAQCGPNGLARHALDHRHCVKHGDGTWDCIVGEFS